MTDRRGGTRGCCQASEAIGGREWIEEVSPNPLVMPDRAQHRPEQEAYAEADFYYDRDGLPGGCVFCDGPDHDQPIRKESDQRERGKLADLGYRILTIRYDSRLEDQLAANRDVFGAGNQAIGG